MWPRPSTDSDFYLYSWSGTHPRFVNQLLEKRLFLYNRGFDQLIFMMIICQLLGETDETDCISSIIRKRAIHIWWPWLKLFKPHLTIEGLQSWTKPSLKKGGIYLFPFEMRVLNTFQIPPLNPTPKVIDLKFGWKRCDELYVWSVGGLLSGSHAPPLLMISIPISLPAKSNRKSTRWARVESDGVTEVWIHWERGLFLPNVNRLGKSRETCTPTHPFLSDPSCLPVSFRL